MFIVCCIFRKNRRFDESSSESSSSSSDDSDSDTDNDRKQCRKHSCGNNHGDKHGNEENHQISPDDIVHGSTSPNKGEDDSGECEYVCKSKKRKIKRPPSPNAYEKAPKYTPKDKPHPSNKT